MFNLKGSKILVTGTSGFIGSRLAVKLLDQGVLVYGVSRKEIKFNDGIVWFQGDLSDIEFVENLISEVRPDYIVHLASRVLGSRDVKYVIPTLRNNLITTINILIVVQKFSCKKIVLGGSFEEGSTLEDELIPNSSYTAAKIAASNYARMFHELYNTPVCIASIYMVYGPGQKDLSKLVPYVILKTLKGEPPEISSGKRKIDWIYVDDVVSGLISMLTAANIEGQTIELGTGKSISTKKFVEELTGMIDQSIKPKFGVVKDRLLEHEQNAKINETIKKIGWYPVTRLESGLRKTIQHYSKL